MGISRQCKADVFVDDFNDGDDNGWIAVTADAPGSSVGDWRVEDNMIKEYSSEGDYKFLRNDLNVGSQMIESKVFSNPIAGWGGVTIWYEDANNWVDVFMYPGYGDNSLWVIEFIGGISQTYKYPLTSDVSTWYLLKVNANDLTGKLKIYLDNEYILTHAAVTTHRLGRSGFTTGNNGANFDDFSVSWNDNSKEKDNDNSKYNHEYKHYKKFKDGSNKKKYKALKNLKKTNYAEFWKLREIYERYRLAGDLVRSQLDTDMLNNFDVYKKYRGYKKYLFYKDKINK